MKSSVLIIIIISILFFKCSDVKVNNHSDHSIKSDSTTNQPIISNSSPISFEKEYSTGDYHLLYENENLLDSLKQRLKVNDRKAFAELMMIYGLTGHKNEFLEYALYFGSVHNNEIACHMVYQILKEHEDEDLKHIANVYLLKAYKLGRHRSESENERFKDSLITLEKYLENNTFKSN